MRLRELPTNQDPASYRPWWETPGNLNCKSDSKLCPAFPSFWVRMRLGYVSTYAHRPGATGLVKVAPVPAQAVLPA
ncbi:hypothetical protein STANM309S_00199 [Streptomyces tanashiensis]